jgi:AsmA protein
MKRVFSYGLAGAAALVALAAAAPLLVSANVYKDQIESGITRATGRKFAIAGPLHFALFPAPTIRADRVALAGIPRGNARFLATADDVQLGVRLWPLLFGRLELTRIVLDKPTIALEVSADGRANWIFEHAAKAKAGKSGIRFSVAAHFSDVGIVRGSVTYANARTGTKYRFEDVDAAISLAEPDRPATASGSFTSARQRILFRAKVNTPEQFLKARDGKLELSLASHDARASFSGAVTPDGRISGYIQMNAASLRDTAKWLGARMPDSSGFGALSLHSTIEGDNRSVALTKLTATLDGMRINGDLKFAVNAPLPLMEGALSFDRLDLDPYIAHRHRPGTAHRAPGADDWSNEPVSLDILKKANAQLAINTGKLTLRNLTLGKTKLRIGLLNGKLDAVLFPMSLYGGGGTATLTIDTNGNVPVFHNELEFNNVALQPFFADTIGVKQIEGTGTIRLDLTSAGASPQAIVRRMNGKGSIAFHNGRLRGIDMSAVARAIQSLLGGAIKPDSFTSFATMSGSFAVTNGILVNKDFELIGPVFKTTGSGTVDVGNRSIDFRIVPQASAIIAKHKLSIGVPFRIKGPWKHVHYTADITGMLHSVLGNLETGKAPFKGLFGPSKPKDPNAPKKKRKSVGDALKNMFGIH